MDTWYIDSWQHLMGALDDVLDDVRSNAASLRESHPGIDRLLSTAEEQRAAAEVALRELCHQTKGACRGARRTAAGTGGIRDATAGRDKLAGPAGSRGVVRSSPP